MAKMQGMGGYVVKDGWLRCKGWVAKMQGMGG